MLTYFAVFRFFRFIWAWEYSSMCLCFCFTSYKANHHRPTMNSIFTSKKIIIMQRIALFLGSWFVVSRHSGITTSFLFISTEIPFFYVLHCSRRSLSEWSAVLALFRVLIFWMRENNRNCVFCIAICNCLIRHSSSDEKNIWMGQAMALFVYQETKCAIPNRVVRNQK